LGVHVRHRLFLGDPAAPQASDLPFHSVDSANCSSLILELFLYSSLCFDSYTQHRISCGHLPIAMHSSINGRDLNNKTELSDVHTTKYILLPIIGVKYAKLSRPFRCNHWTRQMIPNMKLNFLKWINIYETMKHIGPLDFVSGPDRHARTCMEVGSSDQTSPTAASRSL